WTVIFGCDGTGDKGEFPCRTGIYPADFRSAPSSLSKHAGAAARESSAAILNSRTAVFSGCRNVRSRAARLRRSGAACRLADPERHPQNKEAKRPLQLLARRLGREIRATEDWGV